MIRPASAVLLALLVPVVSLSGCSEGASRAAVVPDSAEHVSTVAAGDLASFLDAGLITLIDVRTPEEFAEGHIAGAVNLPLGTFEPGDVPVKAGTEPIFYCRSARRSQIAAQDFAEAEGRPVRHLQGGIIAWQDANLPVE